MRDFVQNIVDTFHVTRGSTRPKHRILLTAPHAAAISEPLDDPCTRSIAEQLEKKVRERLGLQCKTCIASVGRVHADQNRLWSIPLVNDVASAVIEHAQDSANRLSDTLHVDVHSFTVTDSANTSNPLPTGWGTGLNILTLYGDKSQYEMAQRMKLKIDQAFMGVQCYNGTPMPQTTVVMHPEYPDSVHNDESNAMIELSRKYGAMSILIEFPTVLNDDSVYQTTCPEHLLVEAVIQALGNEVAFSRR